MYNAKDYADMWKIVIEKYDEQMNTEKEKASPRMLIENLLKTYNKDLIKETFSVVAKIKSHDGRIYGENRRWTDNICILIDPSATVWDRKNPMMQNDLDYIPPVHINQLITELRILTK